ncbi:acyl-CoA carboxylase subunit epsilon [Mobilicoccus caccae]|uniref:Acyl-CoA carboxylase epsilon subunit-like protein n=1 Tax=Mobilicoccus caccae TaxID=1859295 RepID=A0ABQ6IN26_9MICO|nr:acyl-CoA carboxylase subunit epsilon [Mobilicoccus caccae]GMA38582.1 hypothetical protein GCM10025883_06270 [Mobilicoccus caccae]
MTNDSTDTGPEVDPADGTEPAEAAEAAETSGREGADSADDTGGDTGGDTDAAPEPVVAITGGNPTVEEVAAVTVLLAALGSDSGSAEPNLRRGWARPSRRFGGGVSPALGWGRR